MGIQNPIHQQVEANILCALFTIAALEFFEELCKQLNSGLNLSIPTFETTSATFAFIGGTIPMTVTVIDVPLAKSGGLSTSWTLVLFSTIHFIDLVILQQF